MEGTTVEGDSGGGVNLLGRVVEWCEEGVVDVSNALDKGVCRSQRGCD